MSRFSFSRTAIGDLWVAQRHLLSDHRGDFSRFFCGEEFQSVGFGLPIAQINQTLTRLSGAVRGLHFQYPPHAEDKIVSCLRGEIFDVAVDIRAGSPTFLCWHGEVLSGENHKSMVIPQGFAHGFQALTDNCELLYLHSRPHAPHHEGALNARDPAIGVRWPLPFTDMSERDANHPAVTNEFTGIRA